MHRYSRVALVTGASRGLGRAVATTLAARGWRVIVDARDPRSLTRTVAAIPHRDAVVAIPGDVADPAHRARLAGVVAREGGLDLLVNNAGALGPSPLPRLADHPLDDLAHVFAVNAIAPLGLVQALLPHLEPRGGRIVNVTSDAAVEAYPHWGGYGASKAALELWTAVLAEEHPRLRVYALDPGDMATEMHRLAAPEDPLEDLPAPETVVPAVMRLATGDIPSGRWRAADLGMPVAA